MNTSGFPDDYQEYPPYGANFCSDCSAPMNEYYGKENNYRREYVCPQCGNTESE